MIYQLSNAREGFFFGFRAQSEVQKSRAYPLKRKNNIT